MYCTNIDCLRRTDRFYKVKPGRGPELLRNDGRLSDIDDGLCLECANAVAAKHPGARIEVERGP